MPWLRSYNDAYGGEPPQDLVRIRRRSSAWTFVFRDKAHRISDESFLPTLVETFPRSFVIASEWSKVNIVKQSRILMKGAFSDGTPLIYRTAPPVWKDDDLISTGRWEFFIGDRSYVAERDAKNRMFAVDDKGEKLVEARAPWEDSESGVEWIVKLFYKLDDPNVQLGLVLAPWAISQVLDYSSYVRAQMSGPY